MKILKKMLMKVAIAVRTKVMKVMEKMAFERKTIVQAQNQLNLKRRSNHHQNLANNNLIIIYLLSLNTKKQVEPTHFKGKRLLIYVQKKHGKIWDHSNVVFVKKCMMHLEKISAVIALVIVLNLLHLILLMLIIKLYQGLSRRTTSINNLTDHLDSIFFELDSNPFFVWFCVCCNNILTFHFDYYSKRLLFELINSWIKSNQLRFVNLV